MHKVTHSVAGPALLLAMLAATGCFQSHGREVEPLPGEDPPVDPVPDAAARADAGTVVAPPSACEPDAAPTVRVELRDETDAGTCVYGEVFGSLTELEPAPEVDGIRFLLLKTTRDVPPYACRVTVHGVGTDLASRISVVTLVNGRLGPSSVELVPAVDCLAPGCEGSPVLWAVDGSAGGAVGAAQVHVSDVSCIVEDGCRMGRITLAASGAHADRALLVDDTGGSDPLPGTDGGLIRGLRLTMDGCGFREPRASWVVWRQELDRSTSRSSASTRGE